MSSLVIILYTFVFCSVSFKSGGWLQHSVYLPLVSLSSPSSPPSGEPHILSGPYSSMHSALHALFLFPETDLILGFLSLGGVMVVGSFTVGAVVFTVVIGCPGVCHYQQLLDVTLYKYKKEKKKRGREVRLLCQQHWCQHLSQTEITGWKIFTPAEKGL